jgi:hypothetical protein
MFAIPTSIVKLVPYVGPITSGVGLALDVKEIVEIATPVGAAKIIAGRLVNECTPPELLIAEKCVMLAGGIVASFATGGNLFIISGTVSAVRSILQD